MEILVAQAEEERLAGVAYDWSKCYDRLPLRLLREVAEAAGVPARLVEPMLHAYGLPRRVICEGLAGEVRVPTHGLTPGCPAATDWLALLMTPWLKTVRGQDIEGKGRAYVDDIVGWKAGQYCLWAVERMVEVTLRFSGDTTLVLHDTKSCRFATEQDDVTAMKMSGGPDVAEQFRDLGVKQITDPGVKVDRSDRISSAVDKLGRIAVVPVGFLRRSRLVGTSGVPTLSFGLAAHPIEEAELGKLRSDVKLSLLRGSKQASTEAIFYTVGLPRRLDPLTHVVLGPWKLLIDTVRGSAVSMADLERLWERTSLWKSGVMAAARQALDRAGVRGGLHVWAAGELALAEPLLQGGSAARDFLCDALEAEQLRLLQAKRTNFGGVCTGVDGWARKKIDRKLALDFAQSGALRAARLGNVVTQVKARQKWGVGSELCPYCESAPETVFHRYWRCDRWAACRAAACRELPEDRVRAEAPGLTLRTGVVPVDVELRDAKQAAESRVEWVDDREICAERGFSDGGAVYANDPWLRRCGWGVAWNDGTRWQGASGPTPGRQTEGRSELYAVLWIVRRARRGVVVVSDSRYGCNGCKAIMELVMSCLNITKNFIYTVIYSIKIKYFIILQLDG